MDSYRAHPEQTPHLSSHHQVHHHHHRCHHHHHHHHLSFLPLSQPSHYHHHHHHIYVVPHCATHNKISQPSNSSFCPNLINPPLQNPQQSFTTAPFMYQAAPHSSCHTPTLQDDDIEELEDEDEEEPVFVMTDEWREFFEKSEARRREAKELAKKQGKK